MYVIRMYIRIYIQRFICMYVIRSVYVIRMYIRIYIQRERTRNKSIVCGNIHVCMSIHEEREGERERGTRPLFVCPYT